MAGYLGPRCPIDAAHGRLLAWGDERYYCSHYCSHEAHGGNGRFFTREEVIGVNDGRKVGSAPGVPAIADGDGPPRSGLAAEGAGPVPGPSAQPSSPPAGATWDLSPLEQAVLSGRTL